MAIKKVVVKEVIWMTIIFTLLDWVLHFYELLIPGLDYLPPNYFIYKVIALPILLYILIVTFRLRSHALCWAAAFALQTRYYLTAGYDLKTNLIMIAVHYVLILVAFKIMVNPKFRRMVKL